MTITEIKTLINKAKVKSKDAAILLIYAIENNIEPACVLITEQDIQNLSKANVIYIDRKGKPQVNYSLLKDKAKENKNKEIYDYVKDNIEEYRKLWKGLFTGSMGTPSACIDKLTEWLINNPQYTFEDVLKAANYWIDSKSKEVENLMILGQADYFIYKNVDGVQTSRLSSVIEEALENASTSGFETLI